jgi:hypothetical protein
MVSTKVVNLSSPPNRSLAYQNTSPHRALQKTQSRKKTKQKTTNNLFFWNKDLSQFSSTASDQELQKEFYGRTFSPNSTKAKMQPYYTQLDLLKRYGTAKMIDQDLGNNKNSWWSFKFLKKFLTD